MHFLSISHRSRMNGNIHTHCFLKSYEWKTLQSIRKTTQFFVMHFFLGLYIFAICRAWLILSFDVCKTHKVNNVSSFSPLSLQVMAKKVEALESRRRVSSIPIPVMCQKVANRKEKWEIEYLLSASPAVPAHYPHPLSASAIHQSSW